MTSWLSSRQRSIFGTISCSSRIACRTRASVEKPVLPRRFLDRPSLLNRISPSCWGEPIVNSVPARSQISRSSVATSSLDAPADPLQALGVQPHALDLHAPQHLDQRQLDLIHQRPQPAVEDLLALPLGQRADEHGIGGRRVLQVGGEAALLADLAEREAAARGLEQERAQQRVVADVLRDRAERLGVVREDRAVAAREDQGLRPVDRADQHLAARGRAEAPLRLLGEQRPLGGLGRLHRDRDLAAGERGDVGHGPLAQTRAQGLRRCGRRRGRIADRPAPPPGAAAGRAARTRGRRRAASSGPAPARRPPAGRWSTPGTSRLIVASCLEMRASSACSVRFCLRLAPRDLVDASRAPSRGRRSAAAARDAVLSPMPGTPGMLSDVSPLSP